MDTLEINTEAVKKLLTGLGFENRIIMPHIHMSGITRKIS